VLAGARRPAAGAAGDGMMPGPLVVAALAALGLAGGCSGGETVALGERSPRPYHFGTPQLLAELGTAYANDNPTLTADLLEIFFTSDRATQNTDVWSARRAQSSAPFDAPALVTAVSTSAFETSSAISADGLTLWVGSDRPGGLGDLDIWMSTRPTRGAAWSAPVNLLSMNSADKDLPRPPGQHELVMPLASQRGGLALYQTFLAPRANRSAPFGAPQAIPELAFGDKSTVDAFLTDDGLTLFFSSGLAGATADLYVAWRRSISEPFSIYEPLDDLNTTFDERDPWLSPDGKLLFFTSDRGGLLNIYQASVNF
jgi:hypothetical protein